jgi:predicted RNA-binding Zn-ribbon protein involved in translation (DUF1610 family)
MYIGKNLKVMEYQRPSKLGVVHTYTRIKTIVQFICDNCGNQFERDLKKVQSKRLNNHYFHCCNQCDSKRFAQRKGVERKTIWDMPASVELPVGKY